MQNSREIELLNQIKDLQEQIKNLKKQKKYGLVWEEKEEKIDKNLLPIFSENPNLRIEDSENKPYNLIIEGDNFYTLSVLQNTHKGKIDVIYIDPPYNTGNKDFIYNDDYVDKEDSFRHSKWLSFMEKRLKLAKNLLKDNGVIFISIDDNEQANLKLLCDGIFSEENVETFIWNKEAEWKSGTLKNINRFRNIHEYIHICYKNKQDILFSKISEALENVKFQTTNLAKNNSNKKWDKDRIFEIVSPNWKIWKDEWKYDYEKINFLLENNMIYFWKDFNNKPREILPTWDDRFVYLTSILTKWSTTQGTKNLQDILPDILFSYPKPLNLLKVLLNVKNQKNSIILDFFAWSGTTWHAVLELNKEDGWNRQFILCSNTEATAENPEKNICKNITYERNKRVITGYTNAKWEQIEWLGWNLRYYKTEFIPKNESLDDLRYSFIQKCDDLLCIKENTFTKVDFWKKIAELKIFKNKNNFTIILYDILYFSELKKIIENLEDKNISLYIFSQNKNMFEEEFENFENLHFANIPDEILETYQKIFGL